MEPQNRLFVSIIVVVVAVVGLIFLQPAVEDRILPDPELAWVGIEIEGSGVARVGRVEIESGTPFVLHAILQARTASGGRILYTEAERVVLGRDEIPAAEVRRWNRRHQPRLRWFTVEGKRPFLDLTNLDPAESLLAQLEMVELFQPNWPMSWSIPGELESANDDHLETDPSAVSRSFGTQRFHVRFEFYEDEHALVPNETIRSWGGQALPREAELFPTIVAGLSGAAHQASRVFGRTQLVLSSDLDSDNDVSVEELTRLGLAFTKVSVIRDHVAASGKRFGDLDWRSIDLRGELSWGDQAGEGDLLRVGDRIVVLYRDAGVEGRLDYDDLCFDFVRGAAIRVLSDVFAGEGEAVQFAGIRE